MGLFLFFYSFFLHHVSSISSNAYFSKFDKVIYILKNNF